MTQRCGVTKLGMDLAEVGGGVRHEYNRNTLYEILNSYKKCNNVFQKTKIFMKCTSDRGLRESKLDLT